MHFAPLYNWLISEGIFKNTNEAAIFDMTNQCQVWRKNILISRAVGKRAGLSSRDIIELVRDYKHEKALIF